MLGNPRVKLVHYVGRQGRSGEDGPRPPPTSPASATTTTSTFRVTRSDAGCTYAKDFADLQGRRQGAGDHLRPHRTRAGYSGLVVQYFFFYYFNQFNDVHEGDWEGMQIAFDADTPARGTRRRARADRALPARRRGAGRLGRRQGPEGAAPTRSSIRRLARTRPSTTTRSTSRTVRTARASAATTPPSR